MVAFEVGDTNGLCGCDSDDPDTTQVFVRDLVAGTTEPVSVGRRWVPQPGKLALVPWPARAGKRLTATMRVLAGGGPVASAKPACTATLAGRRLALVGRGFRGSSVRCAWQIPKTARGKRLAGSLSATIRAGTAIRRFAATVQ